MLQCGGREDRLLHRHPRHAAADHQQGRRGRLLLLAAHQVTTVLPQLQNITAIFHGNILCINILRVRKQRNGLVQTEEQYVFIHDALVEAIEAGETHITKACLPKYIHSLQCIDVTDEKPNPCKVLEKQYKVIREIGAET